MAVRKSARTNKSDRTRAAILGAARELFASLGYEKTTIRDIAAKACIDPALVIRYFGGKDDLFARAAAIELELPPLNLVAPEAVGEALAKHFLEVWEGSGSGTGMAIMLRSAASNEFAAERIREAFSRQVGPMLATVGKPETAPRRAGLISSQLLGLALCRYILRLPPIVALSHDEIIKHVGPVLQRYATDPAA